MLPGNPDPPPSLPAAPQLPARSPDDPGRFASLAPPIRADSAEPPLEPRLPTPPGPEAPPGPDRDSPPPPDRPNPESPPDWPNSLPSESPRRPLARARR